MCEPSALCLGGSCCAVADVPTARCWSVRRARRQTAVCGSARRPTSVVSSGQSGSASCSAGQPRKGASGDSPNACGRCAQPAPPVSQRHQRTQRQQRPCPAGGTAQSAARCTPPAAALAALPPQLLAPAAAAPAVPRSADALGRLSASSPYFGVACLFAHPPAAGTLS